MMVIEPEADHHTVGVEWRNVWKAAGLAQEFILMPSTRRQEPGDMPQCVLVGGKLAEVVAAETRNSAP